MRRLSLCVVTVLACGTFAVAQHNMSTMTVDNNLGELSGEAFEIAFMSGMVAHHEGAVDMARWILERTERPGVASRARQIIAAQEPEIKLMQSWLDEWYAGQRDDMAASMMASDMQGMIATMDAASDPDVAFLREMSLHHSSAIDMAQIALLKATHPKLRELAKNIVRNQAQEIADYQEMLREIEGR